ncbi:MAG TPA: hypothetical protein VM581_03850 [Magnetospirillaceae bacterium]|nr:hypothetical protein [Magnetospirillaceae bacterium]
MSPRGERLVLNDHDRLLALLVAEGLSDGEIAAKTGICFGTVSVGVKSLLARLNVSRLALALVVLTRVLNDNETLGWTSQAEVNRQRLHDARVVDLTTARFAARLATNEYWLASDAIIGRHEQMRADMVAYSLAPWERVLGGRIQIQVTMRLAPIKPLFWRATDRHR